MNRLRSSGNGRALFRLLAAFTLGAAVALGLYACKSSTDEEGVVDIGLTDAAGDFLSYAVDVTSLTLTKADGTAVQTLPQRTRIDFSQLVDLTEFVTGLPRLSRMLAGGTFTGEPVPLSTSMSAPL